MNALNLNRVVASSFAMIVIGAMACMEPVVAAEIVYPVTFADGNTLTANDLNANFDEVKTVVNGNAAIVAFVAETKIVGLNIGESEIQQVSIVAPGPGKVVVSFSAAYTMNHAENVADQIQIGIADSTDAVLETLTSRRILFLDGSYPGGQFNGSVASHAAFTVTSPGEYTYYILGLSNKGSASPSFSVSNPSTQALFVADP